jgi:hypothetical protein
LFMPWVMTIWLSSSWVCCYSELVRLSTSLWLSRNMTRRCFHCIVKSSDCQQVHKLQVKYLHCLIRILIMAMTPSSIKSIKLNQLIILQSQVSWTTPVIKRRNLGDNLASTWRIFFLCMTKIVQLKTPKR